MGERPRGARVAPRRPTAPRETRESGPSRLAVHLALAVARVGADPSVEGVRTLVTGEGVVAVAPGQGVVTAQAMQDVGQRIAGQVVGERTAVQVLYSRYGVRALARGRPGGQARRDRALGKCV